MESCSFTSRKRSSAYSSLFWQCFCCVQPLAIIRWLHMQVSIAAFTEAWLPDPYSGFLHDAN